MSNSQPPDVPPTPHFQRLSSHILLYTPQAEQSLSSNELILFCPWLGATPRHMAKYAALLTRIAPAARIVLLPSSLSTLFSPRFIVRRALEPAMTVIESVLANGQRQSCQPRILIYTMSNGGCFNVVRMLRALRESRGVPLAVAGIVLDSCPGRGTYGASIKAMELTLPRGQSPLLKWPIMLIFRLWFGLLGLLVRFGWPHPIEIMRKNLISDRLLVGTEVLGKSPLNPTDAHHHPVKAQYIFSRSDALIPWRDVQLHIDAARTSGWEVDENEFEESVHCAHYLNNPERYERILRAAWEEVTP